MDNSGQCLSESIRLQLNDAQKLHLALGPLRKPLERLVERVVASYRAGGKLILFGNGGSAADAQHIAAEMLGHFRHDRSSWPALALTTNTSVLTAIGNDYSYEQIFSRQVKAFSRPDDIVIGITTSGRSTNVLKGLQAAREKQSTSIAFCGAETEALVSLCDDILSVPSTDTPRIQEVHILLGHILCQEVECLLLQ